MVPQPGRLAHQVVLLRQARRPGCRRAVVPHRALGVSEELVQTAADRVQHSEHVGDAHTQKREDRFALDVDALPASHRARDEQRTARTPRRGLVDLDTGQMQDDDPAVETLPRTRTERGPRA